jgi:two-component system, chemotaxis family, CheB/CheR fusion protein
MSETNDVKPEEAAENHAKSKAGLDFPVVGIGASAGGLEAMTSFFSGMPEKTGIAFVIIQHLDPSHPSTLHELLRRLTKMSVLEAKNDIIIGKKNQE